MMERSDVVDAVERMAGAIMKISLPNDDYFDKLVAISVAKGYSEGRAVRTIACWMKVRAVKAIVDEMERDVMPFHAPGDEAT